MVNEAALNQINESGGRDHRKTHMGPIMKYFEMEGVSEIMVNRYDEIFIKKKGEMIRVEEKFDDDFAVVSVLQQVAYKDDQPCDDDHPEVNARLWDGSRFCGLLFPWSYQGTSFTIRLFSDEILQPSDLVSFGSLTPEMMNYLKHAMQFYKNILVSGSTDSGKTTLLNALLTFIDQKDRLLTVEDTPEIKTTVPNKSQLVSVNKRDSSGKKTKTLADLIKVSLRANPTRVCVGEIRDTDSAVAFIRAIHTGHSGCISTLHANDPQDAIERLTELLGESGKPIEFARKQVTTDLHVVIQAEEIKGLGKRIVQIAEIDRAGNHKAIFDFDYMKRQHCDGVLPLEESNIYKQTVKFGIEW